MLTQIFSADVTTSIVGTQENLLDASSHIVGDLGSTESVISSCDGGALPDFVTPIFTNVDQGWLQASDALLNASQGLDTALVGDSGLEAAELAVISADLSLFGDLGNSLSIELTSALF